MHNITRISNLLGMLFLNAEYMVYL